MWAMVLLAALEVLRLIAAAEGAQAELRREYVYEEVQENWRLDPLGREMRESYRSKGYTVVWVNGGRYRKLVARNGQELTAEERWQVEEDMRRFRPEAEGAGWLAYEGAELELQGNRLRITTGNKRMELVFDPGKYQLREQTIETATARTRVEYVEVDGRVTLPARTEVDFVVEGVRGRQVSTFGGHRVGN